MILQIYYLYVPYLTETLTETLQKVIHHLFPSAVMI